MTSLIVQDSLDLVVIIQEKIKKTPLRRLPLEWTEVLFTQRKWWSEIELVMQWQLSLRFRLRRKMRGTQLSHQDWIGVFACDIDNPLTELGERSHIDIVAEESLWDT